ncbi:50S ribosomal protein L31 [Dehalococcoidia bacterium]|nr:50S ribosomal protein L31 [Dehalococcoidia bacterium]
MKAEIHPEYHTDSTVTCSCGNVFSVGSTKKDLKVEICSTCHPFFTGTQRIVDTQGRVERLKKRFNLD